MSLIPCPACSKEVSENAPACPNCGEPIKSSVAKAAGGAVNMKDPVHAVGMVLVVIIGLAIFLYAINALVLR